MEKDTVFPNQFKPESTPGEHNINSGLEFLQESIQRSLSKTNAEKELYDKLTATNLPVMSKRTRDNHEVGVDLLSSLSSDNSGKEIDSRILKLKHSLDESELGKISSSVVFDDTVDTNSNIIATGDVFNIKDSLREHYQAIKELQNAIIQGKRPQTSSDSFNITTRIKNIEATLRDLSIGHSAREKFRDEYSKLSHTVKENQVAIELLKCSKGKFDENRDVSYQSGKQHETSSAIVQTKVLKEEVLSLQSSIQKLQHELKSLKLSQMPSKTSQGGSKSRKEENEEVSKLKFLVYQLQDEIMLIKEGQTRESNSGKAQQKNEQSVPFPNLGYTDTTRLDKSNIYSQDHKQVVQQMREDLQNELKEEIEILKSQLHKSKHDLKTLTDDNARLEMKYALLDKTMVAFKSELKEIVKVQTRNNSENNNHSVQKGLRDASVNSAQSEQLQLDGNGEFEPDYPETPKSANTTCDTQKLFHQVKMIKVELSNKVDTSVLQELARHIATRQDLKKFVRKSQIEKLIGHQMTSIKSELASQQNKVEIGLSEKISSYETPKTSISELQTKVQIMFKNLVEERLNALTDRLAKLEDKPNSMPPQEAAEFTTKDLAREFDQKLFMLCSELTNCKSLFAMQANQPFYRCAQWIWNSGKLKLGSAIPWNLETTNTDPDNFKWEQDHYNIRIQDAGLYEINFSFFTKAKPSIQIVVNGESVLSAINSPSYVVQHSSGFVMDGNGKVEQGTVTGISLVDFLALPAKSTISIHYHGIKKNLSSHGFFSLKRI
ncbi:hypothetical protein HDV01_006621 [Terramyces sp. JEL0728]|nr:hypothetical protein HDV01_006621 [Terramyces sp. JEL0728]